MENFFTACFYIFGILSVLCGLFCMFEENISKVLKALIISFILTALLILLLKAPLSAIFEAVLFGVIIGGALNIIAKITDNGKKSLEFDFKTIFAPFLGIIFIIMLIPFIFLTFTSFTEIGSHGFFDVLNSLFTNGMFQIIALLIYLIATATGITAILNVRNMFKKIKSLKDEIQKDKEGEKC